MPGIGQQISFLGESHVFGFLIGSTPGSDSWVVVETSQFTAIFKRFMAYPSLSLYLPSRCRVTGYVDGNSGESFLKTCPMSILIPLYWVLAFPRV